MTAPHTVGAPPQRILACTDFSEASRHAVQHAAREALAGGGEVVLLHVVEGLEAAGEAHATATGVRTALADLTAQARERLAETVEELEAAGVAASARVAEGRAADRILEVVEAERIDLVVVATHGMGGVKRLLLGSVAAQVAKRAAVPVLLVR